MQRFKQFIKEHILLTTPCYTKGAVEDMTKECDLLICSDAQVRNQILFLDFDGVDQKWAAYTSGDIFHRREEYRHIYEQMAKLIKKLDVVIVGENVDILQFMRSVNGQF